MMFPPPFIEVVGVKKNDMQESYTARGLGTNQAQQVIDKDMRKVGLVVFDLCQTEPLLCQSLPAPKIEASKMCLRDVLYSNYT